MEPSHDVSTAALRELFDRLGLAPSDEQLERLLPAVVALQQAARRVEAMLQQADEPGTTLRLGE